MSKRSALFPLHVHMTSLLSLTCVSLSQQVSLAWCYGACCLLFPVLSAPSWSRQMAALPGSGSDGGFFLLKGSFFSPQSPRAAQDGRLNTVRRCYWVFDQCEKEHQSLFLFCSNKSFKVCECSDVSSNHLPLIWGWVRTNRSRRETQTSLSHKSSSSSAL